MVIFTLTLLAFFISLSMQMMNQLFLGQSMGVAIAAVILPLVLTLILSLIACQQYGQSRWIVVPTTLLLLRRTSYPSDTTSAPRDTRLAGPMAYGEVAKAYKRP